MSTWQRGTGHLFAVIIQNQLTSPPNSLVSKTDLQACVPPPGIDGPMEIVLRKMWEATSGCWKMLWRMGVIVMSMKQVNLWYGINKMVFLFSILSSTFCSKREEKRGECGPKRPSRGQTSFETSSCTFSLPNLIRTLDYASHYHAPSPPPSPHH
jgi:hypothetical protein